MFTTQAFLVGPVAAPKHLARNDERIARPPFLFQNITHHDLGSTLGVGLCVIEKIGTAVVRDGNNCSAVSLLICCANVTHAPNESSLSCNPDFPRRRYFIFKRQEAATFLRAVGIYGARGQIAGVLEAAISL